MSLEELRSLIVRHARDGATSTAIDGVLVSTVDEAGPPTLSPSGVILAIVAQGGKRIALSDRVYDYHAGQFLVASVDLPIAGQFTDASPERPALGFGLQLRPAVVADLLLHPAAAGFPRASSRNAVPALAVGTASPALVDAAVRMLRLLDNPRDLPVLAPLVEREMHWLLMTGEQGATVRQLGLADSSVSRVAHAVRWIRDRYADKIMVEDLAQLTRMSTSAFHRSFQAVTGLSPIQFQKQVRLQEARMRLISEPGDVAGVAYAVGYESAAQFSREYHRRFGLPPGKDAVRMRALTLGGR